MWLWIENNIAPISIGVGLGAIISHWFDPNDFICPFGAIVGVDVAFLVWRYTGNDDGM